MSKVFKKCWADMPDGMFPKLTVDLRHVSIWEIAHSNCRKEWKEERLQGDWRKLKPILSIFTASWTGCVGVRGNSRRASLLRGEPLMCRRVWLNSCQSESGVKVKTSSSLQNCSLFFLSCENAIQSWLNSRQCSVLASLCSSSSSSSWVRVRFLHFFSLLR